MKISSIQQICKSAKRIELFSPSAKISPAQWLSDGYAFYPLYNLPELEEENVLALFDIPESKQKNISFSHSYVLPETIQFKDTVKNEQEVEFSNISISTRGMLLLPLKTSLGIIYINQKHLKPFSDAENGVQLYERYTPGGEIYIAVKEGFLLTGIIRPYDNIITEEFIKELERIYRLSALTAENKGLHLSKEDEDEQISIEGYND